MNNLLPVFMKLEEVPCLVVGEGKIALQKIHQLIDTKAMITVVSPKIANALLRGEQRHTDAAAYRLKH